MIGGRARLNVFQKTQRLWETIHPYNAAQAMELVGDFPPDRVATSFNDAMTDLGLGEFVCDGRSYSVEPRQNPVTIGWPADGFEATMDREMNRSFEADDPLPFRPFDLQDGGRRIVGLTYRHWVADSVSIRMLMRQWLTRLTGTGGPRPVRLPDRGLLASFGPAAAGWSLLAQSATLVGHTTRMKRMRRVEDKADASVRVVLRAGPDGLVEALRRRVRSAGATVGDAMLAAAAGACDVFGPARPTVRRPDLCLGTIVDLRARGGRAGADVFGLYLGFLMTDFPAGDMRSPARLLARAASARRTAIARRSAEASQLNMAVGYGIGRWIGASKLPAFYRKRFPLSGGLSSVNMTPGWAGAAHPSPMAAYHRVSPTGPQLPLVLTPTTLGDRLRLCCTYRTALTDAARVDRLIDSFLEGLARYAE